MDCWAVKLCASSFASGDLPHQVGWSQTGPVCCRSTGGWLHTVSLVLPAPAFCFFIYMFIYFSRSLCDFKSADRNINFLSVWVECMAPGLCVHPTTSELINTTLCFILHFFLPSQHPSAPHSTGHRLPAMWNSNTFLIITRSQSATPLINIQLFSFHCHRFQDEKLAGLRFTFSLALLLSLYWCLLFF